MRWPLRYQIMLPMTIVMLAVVVALSAIHAYFATRQLKREIGRRVDGVAETLAASNFPLTDAVLEQMKGLAGADFLLTDLDGRVIGSTGDDRKNVDFPDRGATRGDRHLRLVAPVDWNGERFFHAVIRVPVHRRRNAPLVLHALYSEDVYLRQRREAVFPPLFVGGVALVVVIGLALIVAAQASRPLRRLRGQVDKIAEGDFQPLPLPDRDDEIRDLAIAVNKMANMLDRYEEKIRGTERVRLLAQLSGGLAHQLRNSATGARMALDLHRSDCTEAVGCESLDVATRQLVLMEQYLRKFLALGSHSESQPVRFDFVKLVRDLMPLVGPAARHAGVGLHLDCQIDSLEIGGDADAIEQMVLNLLLNAVEASGQPQADGEPGEKRIRVVIHRDVSDCVKLEVEDCGPGPTDAIAAHMFEPFVTDKKDGVGLGLAIANEVATGHGGSIRCDRSDGRTTLIVAIPMHIEGKPSGHIADS